MARAKLEPLLDDDNEILENQETLLRDLQELDSAELQTLTRQGRNDILRGWLSLAYIAKTASDEQQAQQEIDNWQNVLLYVVPLDLITAPLNQHLHIPNPEILH